MNNLTVDHHASRLSKPRKSVIGKLERSSFQAQRLSDVGIAFSQQITAKVGLRLPASQERIVEQTRWLYLRYVFVKLRQNKLPLKDLNLTKGSRSRRAAALLSRLGGINGASGGGGGGASETSSPIVCISEPPSADVLTPLADQRPLFTRQPGIRPGRQSILSIDLDAQDLSLLNARMSSRRNQRLGAALEMPPENMTHNGQLDELASTTTTTSAAAADQLTPPMTPSFDAKRMLLGKLSSSINSLSPFSTPPSPAAAGYFTANTHTTAASLSVHAANATAPTAPATKKFIMDPTINNQILTVISNMINQLRESKPEFYGDTIYEVIGLDKFSSLESLLDVQRTLCQEMTRADISWDRIIALFSLFGAMSLDCVRLGAPEHVGPILDGFIGFVERDLAQWISQQGGWESFLYKFRVDFRYGPLYKAAAIALPVLLAILFAYN